MTATRTVGTRDAASCACGRGADAATPEGRSAAALLGQCRTLLADLPEGVYARPSRNLPGGTVGKHLRHLLDHYFALAGVAETAASIDYDHRERETATETEVLVGLAMIDRAERLVRTMTPDMLAAPVRVRSMLDAGGEMAEHGSTMGREVAFATHHGLHHAAMMGAICREFGVAVSTDFGKAPATAAHEAGRA